MPGAGVTEGASGGTAGAAVVADRYELGALLGRGAMGEVRHGRDRRLGRDVAVKLLLPALATDREARDRFRDEARATARIEHPHVVAVFDTGEHDGVPYLVMERLPGRTLADEIAAGPLPASRVRSLGVQVLGAVQAAHDAGVLHRDIKPSNILLTADGEAKLGDLGIAKMVEGGDRTATGIVVGTPTYLAPERMAGLPATERTDLYAVGVVLREALTGAKPGRSGPTAAQPVDGGDPTLAQVIERARAADPDQRYGSAAEMAAALAAQPSAPAAVRPTSAAATGATRVARSGAPTRRAGAGARRPVGTGPTRTVRRWVAGGVVAAALLATGAVVLDQVVSEDADPAGEDAPRPGATATTSPVTSEPSVEAPEPADEGPATGESPQGGPRQEGAAREGSGQGGSGTDEAGTEEAGTDGSGTYGSGTNEAGIDGSGRDEPGTDGAGKDEPAEEAAEKADEATKEDAEKEREAAKEAVEKEEEAAKEEAEKDKDRE